MSNLSWSLVYILWSLPDCFIVTVLSLFATCMRSASEVRFDSVKLDCLFVSPFF